MEPVMRQGACAFTGHRPEKLPFSAAPGSAAFVQFVDVLDKAIYGAIECGYRHFITGMSRGMDLWAAGRVLYYKKTYPDVILEAAVPCPGQEKAWSFADKAVYEAVLAACDKVTVLSDHYYNGCMHARNRYMVSKATLLLAAYDPTVPGGTRYTVEYAKKQDVPVYNLLDPEISRRALEEKL